VAITRAKRRSTVIHAANRRIYGQWTSSLPSRFVAELPEPHIEQETTMSGGESLWRAQWSERADPFAHVAHASTRGPGWQRGMRQLNPSPVSGEGDSRSRASGVRASRWNSSPPIEARASAVSLGNKGRDDLAVGQRVFHEKFGQGTIAAIEGNKLEIDFEHAGRKKVLDSFVSAG
jgi:DNA helicase-2/ATP-dependent DNA helicase PcrA